MPKQLEIISLASSVSYQNVVIIKPISAYSSSVCAKAVGNYRPSHEKRSHSVAVHAPVGAEGSGAQWSFRTSCTLYRNLIHLETVSRFTLCKIKLQGKNK